MITIELRNLAKIVRCCKENNKIPVVGLVAPAGSGKDFLIDLLFTKQELWSGVGFNRAKITTTRPARNSEESRYYHFVTPQVFYNTLISGNLIQGAEFNNWFYGLNIKDLSADAINILVASPAMCWDLQEEPNIEIIPIKIEVDDKTRLLNQLQREENPNVEEIVRRFMADKEDFSEDVFCYGTFQNKQTEDFDALALDFLECLESIGHRFLNDNGLD